MRAKYNESMSNEDIFSWYDLFVEWDAGTSTIKNFAKEKGISFSVLAEMIYRFKLEKNSNEDEYQKLKDLAIESYSSRLNLARFAESKGVKVHKIDRMRRHLFYKELINSRGEKSIQPMSFIKVPQIETRPILESTPEVIPSKNDIEINITKGVKVVISPNVDSMKIIKIIDLLKDL